MYIPVSVERIGMFCGLAVAIFQNWRQNRQFKPDGGKTVYDRQVKTIEEQARVREELAEFKRRTLEENRLQNQAIAKLLEQQHQIRQKIEGKPIERSLTPLEINQVIEEPGTEDR